MKTCSYQLDTPLQAHSSNVGHLEEVCWDLKCDFDRGTYLTCTAMTLELSMLNTSTGTSFSRAYLLTPTIVSARNKPDRTAVKDSSWAVLNEF